MITSVARLKSIIKCKNILFEGKLSYTIFQTISDYFSNNFVHTVFPNLSMHTQPVATKRVMQIRERSKNTP